MKPSRFLPLLLAVVAGSALAQVKWDLPAAYPASNFHTVAVQGARDQARGAG